MSPLEWLSHIVSQRLEVRGIVDWIQVIIPSPIHLEFILASLGDVYGLHCWLVLLMGFELSGGRLL